MGKLFDSVGKIAGNLVGGVTGLVTPDIPDVPQPQAISASPSQAAKNQDSLPKSAPSPTDQQILDAQKRSIARRKSSTGRNSTILTTGNSTGKSSTLG